MEVILFGQSMLHGMFSPGLASNPLYDEAHRLTSVLGESTDRRGSRQIKGFDKQTSTTPQV